MSTPSITETIDRALRSAGLQPSDGTPSSITTTIRRALDAVGLARETRGPATPEPAPSGAPASDGARRPGAAAPRDNTRPLPGEFGLHHHESTFGKRAYRLYVPQALPRGPAPLVMMLHGCKQTAEDFAIGTRMNRLAEEHGFLVAYPEQTSRANGSNCWNWFVPGDQARGAGEPEILAGIAREVIAQHRVDEGRVYVAGLSAGASMAVILGHAYPDLFAAIGAHSGLPYAAAHDVGSAFSAMHGHGTRQAAERPGSAIPLRTIVFHGAGDHTVVEANGDAIVAQALAGQALQRHTLKAVTTDGPGCRRTAHVDPKGRAQVEQWVLHGGGHAWSGGDPAGSFTDANGPDASAEMARFFLEG